MQVETIRGICPGCKDPHAWALAIGEATARFDIVAKHTLAAFLAQTAHESQEFNRVRENLNYSAAGLVATWPKRFPTLVFASDYARNPQKIANYVYANRLGNGPPESNDGWTYRGGGLIQTTGRENFYRTGLALDLPLEKHPEMIETKRVAALTGAYFWQSHGLNNFTEIDDETFVWITKTINGGTNGLEDRRKYWLRAKAVLA